MSDELPVAEMFFSIQGYAYTPDLLEHKCKTYLMVECPVCQKKFNTQRGMTTHAGQAHPKKKDVWSDKYPREFECPICDREFDTKQGIKVHAGRKHPDQEDEWSDKEQRECKVCGGVFKEYPSVKDECCSPQCANEARRNAQEGKRYGSSEIECEECGEHIIRWNSQIEKYDNHFCSKDCLSEWKKGNSFYIPAQKGFRSHDRLDHDTRSGWEESVALMLVDEEIDYEYEPKKYNLGECRYVPDFVVDNIIIEVKGRASDGGYKIAMLGDQNPELETVVIGADIDGVDHRFPFSEREKVLEVIQ